MDPDPLWLPPTVVSPGPLRPPDAALAGVIAERLRHNLSADGVDHPRAGLWAAAELPLVVLDGLAVVLAVVTGAVWAAVVAVLLGVAAAVLAALILADPLRLTAAQRRWCNDLRLWTSGQDWAAAGRSDTPERALVERAVEAVRTIVQTPWWWQDAAAGVRLQLDFQFELTEIDSQAFRLSGLAGGDPLRAQLGNPLAGRVRALETLAAHVRQQPAAEQIPVDDHPAAIVGSVLDEDGTDRITAVLRQIGG